MITGFDPSASGVLLVDVAAFAANHNSHPGKIVLQDREPVIARVVASSEERQFEAQAHDFFTPQPVRPARVLASLHSPRLGRRGCRQDTVESGACAEEGVFEVLLNEIVVSEEKPTLAATSMDMMMMARFPVRERTEADWNGILEKAGLMIVDIYT
jgi:hypothetical protein